MMKFHLINHHTRGICSQNQKLDLWNWSSPTLGRTELKGKKRSGPSTDQFTNFATIACHPPNRFHAATWLTFRFLSSYSASKWSLLVLGPCSTTTFCLKNIIWRTVIKEELRANCSVFSYPFCLISFYLFSTLFKGTQVLIGVQTDTPLTKYHLQRYSKKGSIQWKKWISTFWLILVSNQSLTYIAPKLSSSLRATWMVQLI